LVSEPKLEVVTLRFAMGADKFFIFKLNTHLSACLSLTVLLAFPNRNALSAFT
jgi:hypothetical protein